MTPPNYRQRLDAIRTRTRAARGRRAELNDALRLARQAGDSDAALLAEDQLHQVEADLSDATQLENALLHQLAGNGSTFRDETFLDNPDTIQTLEALANSSMPIGSMMLGPAIGRDELITRFQGQQLALSGQVDIPDTARQTLYYGVVPQLRRRLRLLDLIPSAPMEGRSFDYTQEGGSFDTAAETVEAATKPEADIGLTDAQVVAKTVAHWTKLKRQQLADVPALGTTVESRLIYGVQRRVENQIVAGDGTGENLLGILATTGIASIAFDSAAPLSDLTLDGITDVLLSEADPNAVVLNPRDRATMLKLKAAGSGERLDSDGAFATPADTLWGLPAIASTVMPQGQALVGDFANGCTLFVREGVNVRISDSDQDDFVKNRLTMLGEGRFGLAVWQPGAFAIVNLAA